MSIDVQARRRRLMVSTGAMVVLAAAGMSPDYIFSELDARWRVGAFGGAVAVVAGLTAFLQRRMDAEQVHPAAPQAHVPHQLLSDDLLVGRETLSAALIERLRDVPTPTGGSLPGEPSAGQAAVTVVHGAAGTGKTALALYAAHRVKEHYPDGQLYVDLRGDADSPCDSTVVLGDFLRALGAAAEEIPLGRDGRAAHFRSLTNNLRLLVFLDNAYSTEQIQPLLPVGPGCSVLVTSRRNLSAGSTPRRKSFAVQLPDEDLALEVLSAWADRERVDADPVAALEIVQFCGRLPLALRIVGGKLRSREDLTLRQMCARLRDERERVRELSFQSWSLQACLSLMYRDLPEPARVVVGLLAFLPIGRLADWHIRAALPASVAPGAIADELVAVGLMEVHGSEGEESGYRFHDLVRVFAHQQYEALPPQERRDAEERLVRAYRDAVVFLAAGRAPELGAEASRRPRSGNLDPATGGAWVTQESERIQWAIGRARRVGLAEEGVELAEAFTYFLDAVRLPADSAGWLFDAGTEQRSRVVGSLRRGRAATALDSGMPETALEVLLPGGAADPAAPLTARDWTIVARAFAAKGDYPAALEHMTTAVRELRADGDRWHVLTSLEKLGEFQRWRGQPEKAEESQREALRLAEEFGDLRAQARLRRTLAETLGYLRRPEEAAPFLEQAVHDFRTLGDRVWEGATLYALGKIYRLLGRREESLERYDKAEDIFGPMGERMWVGRIDNARIRVFAGLERYDDAWAAAWASLDVFRQLRHDQWHAHTQRDIGWLHLRQGRPAEAVEPLTEAVEVTRRAGDAYAEAMARHLRGVAHRELGRPEEARADLEAALAIYQGGAYEWNEAIVLHDLIRALRAGGATAEADGVESGVAANLAFARTRGRDGAWAIPDEE
ncbi:tetratricopeptide repeat protein [Streptomyces sp. NPDC098781]|uniref:tetratricopeptide repeat protein n=1 Tax=Streptomyces sp. NPDC098781 TaxID=3366097 RepID=UPI00381B1565